MNTTSNLNQVTAPSTTVYSQNNGGFSQPVIDKINKYLALEGLKLHSELSKIYLDFIKNISIGDAKQIIYIWSMENNQTISFDHHSEEDILLKLATIFIGNEHPRDVLVRLLWKKAHFLLPVGLHAWLEEDLAAMLFYAQYTPDSFRSKAYSGGAEFTSAFMNFLQFHVVNFDINHTFFSPLICLDNFQIQHYEQQFNNYRYWYSKFIIEKKEFEWLKSLEDEQLDKCLKNLQQKGLRILEGTFYPKNKEDKINLLIASINQIKPIEEIRLRALIKDERTSSKIPRGEYNVREYYNYIIFENAELNKKGVEITYDEDKFEGLGISMDICKQYTKNSKTYVHSVYCNDFNIFKVGKIEEKLINLRDYQLKLLDDSSRQNNKRANDKVTEDELTVKILKKNINILRDLTKQKGITPSKYINHLIEIANETRTS